MKRYAMPVLGVLNVALLAVLASLWLSPDGSLRNARWIAPVPVTNDYLQMLPALPERESVDTNRFLALLERPLFQLTRRPPPPPPPPSAAAAPEAVDNLSTAQLSGVVAGEKTASIIITMAGKARRVRLNDSVDGWMLQSIQGRSVTFSSGGQTRVLQLPRAAVTSSSGSTLPVPVTPMPQIPPPSAAPQQSATQVTPPPATVTPSTTATDAPPKPTRRSRFSSGPE